MKSIKLSIFCLLILGIARLNAFNDSIQPIPEFLNLDLPLFDFPFIRYSTESGIRRTLDQTSDLAVNKKIKDYFLSYENLSMQQALAITEDLHSTNYYLQNKMWNRILPVTQPNKKIFNRIGANVSSGIIDYLLAYQLMIFSPVWLHEEFHRSGLSLQGIGSHNDTYYRFGAKSADAGGSVSKIRDEDLIRFKANDPAGFVRTHASGIESQFYLLRKLQMGNFFQDKQYPTVAMNILLTNAAVNYVNQFKQDDYDSIIDSMNVRGFNPSDRDYVGWDFTAWVYDLFRADQPYTERGTHPLGNGINRIIKRSQLSNTEYDYLVKMGRMQYLNYVSPAMIGIDRIRLNDQWAFNFSMRHILTSFGYDLSLDLFLDHRGNQWLVSLHNYKNFSTNFPGLEIWRNDLFPKLKKENLSVDLRTMLWLQPQNQLFLTDKSQAGGLLGLKATGKISNRLQYYLDLEAKSDGWVAASPYLDKAISFRVGLNCNFSQK